MEISAVWVLLSIFDFVVLELGWSQYTHWDSEAESQHFICLNVTFITCKDPEIAVSFSFMIKNHPFLASIWLVFKISHPQLELFYYLYKAEVSQLLWLKTFS